MKLHPPTAAALRKSYIHPLYRLQLLDLLRGKPFGRSVARVGWIYPLKDGKTHMSIAEISIIRGAHRYVRLTEGRFVTALKRSIDSVARDPRLTGSWELRSIRIEALHLFALWIKKKSEESVFVPVNSLGKSFKAGQYYTQEDFVQRLLPEAKRIQDAHATLNREKKKAEL